MIGIAYNYSAGAPAVSGVNTHAALFGILNDSLNGRRFGTDYGDNAVCGHNIAKADVDQFNIHALGEFPFLASCRCRIGSGNVFML